MYKIHKKLLFLILVLVFLISACEAFDSSYNYNNSTCNDISTYQEDRAAEPAPVNVTGLQPNEKGSIMILMYHQIGDEEGTWTRTRENFLSDLELLYDKGYRLVSLRDYLDDNMDTPLGTTPVVLTFDDGSPGQFDFKETQEGLQVDPESAVGIMSDFYEEHPDFGLEAAFYVNWKPFNKEYWQEALQKIDELGMDIGNHTLNHINLQYAPKEEYPREIGGLAAHVQEALPGYQIDTLALPYGGYPSCLESALKGEFQGKEYKNRALLLVGANPAPSPLDADFDPLKIPRIRADEENLTKWIEYFESNPEKRYVSSGKSIQ